MLACRCVGASRGEVASAESGARAGRAAYGLGVRTATGEAVGSGVR